MIEKMMTTINRTVTHKHLKSGNLITVIGRGRLEEDLTPVVCYVEEPEGELWVRRSEIFDDGRFAPVTIFAWLIEHGGSRSDKPLYMCGVDTFGRFKWTYEHETAVRFSRQQDAHKVASGDHLAENHRVVEHGWDEASGAAPSVDAVEKPAD
jgi:hypothetical protein